MSQAPARGNFTQTLLTFLVIFMGFILISNAMKPTPDVRSSAQIIAELRNKTSWVMDQSAMREKQALDTKIQAELEAGTLSKPAADRLQHEATLLVAYAQYKAGAQLQDVGRMIPAYESLVSLEKTLGKSPVWQERFAVKPDARYPKFTDTTINFAELKDKVATEASRLGRDTLVWGFFPGYQLVDALVRVSGSVPLFSYALAALILAFCVRAVVYPLAQRQMMWSRQLSQLAPLANEIREQYKKKHGDRMNPQDAQEMNARVMALYKEYGVNPASGCLPMFAQMPLFFLIYASMLHYRFEFQNGVFLWINPSTSAATNGFIAANLGEKDYILIVLYGISFVITTLLTPVSDPANAKQQRMIGLSMSVVFSIMMFFWPVPSAFVLYWIFTNIFATAQSLRAYKLPLPPLVKVNSPVGGVYPGPPVSPNLNGKSGSTGVPKKHKPKKRG